MPDFNERNTEPGKTAKTKPEELACPAPGSGEAIKSEASHNPTDAAKRTGDRMWGPPGPPDKR